MAIFAGPEGFWCHRETAQALWSLGYYGSRPDSHTGHRLIDVEALYLSERHAIDVRSAEGSLLSHHALHSSLLEKEGFEGRYQVYTDFRKAGWVVRSGLNYGVDFVLYRASPDEEHARFAVLVLEAQEALSWRRLLGTNRSCVGAKKVNAFSRLLF